MKKKKNIKSVSLIISLFVGMIYILTPNFDTKFHFGDKVVASRGFFLCQKGIIIKVKLETRFIDPVYTIQDYNDATMEVKESFLTLVELIEENSQCKGDSK